jgi:hypothetical protein
LGESGFRDATTNSTIITQRLSESRVSSSEVDTEMWNLKRSGIHGQAKVFEDTKFSGAISGQGKTVIVVARNQAG